MTTVDNIIIGAGPGGYELAASLAAIGESVVVVERDEPGGTCLNRGCIPTKSLCASANAALAAGTAGNLGVDVGPASVDFARVMSRVKDVVLGLRTGVEGLLAKCTFVKGEAVFTSPKVVSVNGEEYTAPRIVIATGSRPALLPIPGAEYALSSDEALWLESLPASIAIIGGGVIGMEFASIFSALGSKVTVIEYCKEILPTVDSEIAKRLRTSLSRRGVEIVVGASVQAIEKTEESLCVKYLGKKGEMSVMVETAVMAVGRRPVIPAGFEGALTPKGFIEVDEYMRTSIDGVYAVGDVNGLLMLAHAAYAQGRVVLRSDSSLFNPRYVPSVVFTNPEVAAVGQKPEELEAAGIKYHVVKRLYASNGKACADGHPEGLVKMLVNDEDDSVLGVTILGSHAAELIAEATILVVEKVPLKDVPFRFIHAHPTLSELFC